jgi:hypothetical protein
MNDRNIKQTVWGYVQVGGERVKEEGVVNMVKVFCDMSENRAMRPVKVFFPSWGRRGTWGSDGGNGFD